MKQASKTNSDDRPFCELCGQERAQYEVCFQVVKRTTIDREGRPMGISETIIHDGEEAMFMCYMCSQQFEEE